MVTMSVLESGELFSTSDLRTAFSRPVTGGTLTIEATIIHRGRNMVQAEVTFAREDGKLVGKGTATQVVSRR
jgi:acyl-coenzyme A thioesterase PaaI-like protein